MTGAKILLESFGSGPGNRSDTGASTAPDGQNVRHGREEPSLPAPEPDRRPDPEAGPAQGTGTDLAAEPGSRHDPLTEQRAALERIAAAVENVASEQGALRARCITEVSHALGAVAETLLPRLARDGFAAAVAGATETVARQGRWPELTLRLADADADAVAAMLRPPAGGPALRLVPDPELTPGEARLDWADGGAEIDVGAIIELTGDRFRQRLAAAGKEHDA